MSESGIVVSQGGRIVRRYAAGGPEQATAPQRWVVAPITDIRGATHWVNGDNQVVDRPVSQVTASPTTVPADDTTTVTVSGLVPGNRIIIAGAGVSVEVTAAGATEDFTFDTAGQYKIAVVVGFPTRVFLQAIDVTEVA